MIYSFKRLIRNNKKLSDLAWAVRGLFGITPQSKHEKYFRRKTKHIIPKYMANNKVRKLQIGGGFNVLDGWLNVNIYCGDRTDEKAGFRQAYMDATNAFPFEAESFDYIFAEHMIEHIDYKNADFMIGECFRVLKKGGKIRLATPGYDNLVNILSDNPRELVEKYFQKLVRPQYGSDIPADPSYAVNYMFYHYGHRFIHSRATLLHLLKKHGFNHIEFFKPQISQDDNFTNIERNYLACGKENNEIETLVAEAVK